MGDPGTNDRFVRRFLAAWERRDVDAILGAFAEDAVYHAMPLPPIVGKAALTEWVEHFRNVPPGRLVVRHQAAAGDVVINERTDYITLNSRAVTLPICAAFELRDGRIISWREYFDTAPAKAAYS